MKGHLCSTLSGVIITVACSYSCREHVMACSLIGEHRQAVDATTGVTVQYIRSHPNNARCSGAQLQRVSRPLRSVRGNTTAVWNLIVVFAEMCWLVACFLFKPESLDNGFRCKYFFEIFV